MSSAGEAENVEVSGQGRNRNWLMYALVGLLALYVVFCLIYRLDIYPKPHFDEGAYLKVAKNFALHGVYADYSEDRISYLGPVISVGPTLIVPIALLYKVFGVSIVVGRVVVVVYVLLALVMLYLLTKRLLDTRSAFVAVLFSVVSLFIVNNFLARSVQGELPGMFFVFAGLLLWLTPQKHTLVQLVGVGILFGLASITKNQYGIAILPSLLVAMGVDLLWYRQRRLLYFIIPGVLAGLIYFGWTYYSLYILGTPQRDVAQDMATLRSLTNNFFFNASNINPNLQDLLDSNPLFVPAFLFGLVLFLQRNKKETAWGILFIFLALSFATFVPSFGTVRYLMLVECLTILFMVRLLHVLTNGFRLNWQDLRHLVRSQNISFNAAVGLVAIGMILAMYTRPAYLQVSRIISVENSGVYDMADYLDRNVPLDKIILTWDQELAVVTDHAYHFPPFTNSFDPGDDPKYRITADYIAMGRITSGATAYLSRYMSAYQLVYSVGDYKLYKRIGGSN